MSFEGLRASFLNMVQLFNYNFYAYYFVVMYNVVASFSQNKIAAPLLPILLKYGVRDLLLLQ